MTSNGWLLIVKRLSERKRRQGKCTYVLVNGKLPYASLNLAPITICAHSSDASKSCSAEFFYYLLVVFLFTQIVIVEMLKLILLTMRGKGELILIFYWFCFNDVAIHYTVIAKSRKKLLIFYCTTDKSCKNTNSLWKMIITIEIISRKVWTI